MKSRGWRRRRRGWKRALWDSSVKLTRRNDRTSPQSQTVSCELLVNYGVCPARLTLCVCVCNKTGMCTQSFVCTQGFMSDTCRCLFFLLWLPNKIYMNAANS